MSFQALKNGTLPHGSVLQERARRFAGVRLGVSPETAKPRPELVRAEAVGDRFESRLERFVFRSGRRP